MLIHIDTLIYSVLQGIVLRYFDSLNETKKWLLRVNSIWIVLEKSPKVQRSRVARSDGLCALPHLPACLACNY